MTCNVQNALQDIGHYNLTVAIHYSPCTMYKVNLPLSCFLGQVQWAAYECFQKYSHIQLHPIITSNIMYSNCMSYCFVLSKTMRCWFFF